MTHFIFSPDKTKVLAAQWRAWGLVLVALARRVVDLQRRGDARGEKAARELSECALTAHLTLMQEIAELEDNDPKARHLFGIAAMLALLARFAQRLIRQARHRAAEAGKWLDLAVIGDVSESPQRALTFQHLEPG